MLVKVDSIFFFSFLSLFLGLLIINLEILFNYRHFSNSGIWSWKIYSLKVKYFTKKPAALFIQFLFQDHIFNILIFVKLLNTFLFIVLLLCKIIFIPSLILCLILFSLFMLRASDILSGAHQMSFVLLLGLTIAQFYEINSQMYLFCMYFISGQLILAYFTAGVTKCYSPVWRSGEAISHIFRTRTFGHPFIYQLAQKSRFIRWSLSWGVMAFEITFPLILFVPKEWALVFFILGFLFHLSNAIFMGLNDFIFPFFATYPIVWYCIGLEQFRYVVLSICLYAIFPLLLIYLIKKGILNRKKLKRASSPS